MFLINQKGEAKIVTEEPDAKVKNTAGGGRGEREEGSADGGWKG